MFYAQISEVINAAKGLESSHLFVILLTVIFCGLVVAFIPIIRIIIDGWIERKKLQIKFDEENLRLKHENSNKINDALLVNAESLKTVTEYLKERCNKHIHILCETTNTIKSISDEDKETLKKAIHYNN